MLELVSCTCKTRCKRETCKCLGNEFYCTDMCQCRHYTNAEEIEMDFQNDISEGEYDSDDDDF